MSVFEFNLLIKQHTLIPQSMVSLSNPCYQVGFCTDFISTIQICVTIVQLIVTCSCSGGWVGGGVVGCNKGYLADKNKLHIYCTVYIQDSPRLFVSTACKILWEFRKFSLQNIWSAWRVIYNNNINKILHLFIEVSVVQWIRAGMQRVRSTVQSYYLLDFFCNNIFFQKDAC
jgi:hypothetical protein